MTASLAKQARLIANSMGAIQRDAMLSTADGVRADALHGNTRRALEKKGLLVTRYFPPDDVWLEETDLGSAVRHELIRRDQ